MPVACVFGDTSWVPFDSSTCWVPSGLAQKASDLPSALKSPQKIWASAVVHKPEATNPSARLFGEAGPEAMCSMTRCEPSLQLHARSARPSATKLARLLWQSVEHQLVRTVPSAELLGDTA